MATDLREGMISSPKMVTMAGGYKKTSKTLQILRHAIGSNFNGAAVTLPECERNSYIFPRGWSECLKGAAKKTHHFSCQRFAGGCNEGMSH